MNTRLTRWSGMILVLGSAWPAWAAETGREPAAPRSPTKVVWESPSVDCQGSMPLGNGSIAINAWIEPDGVLRCYLARTDSWDEYGRLLKIGGMRFVLEPAPAPPLSGFRQTLDVRAGMLTARWGEADHRVEYQVWVDAHRPVVVVEATTSARVALRAEPEIWRTTRGALPQAEASDIHRHHPEKMILEPDTVLTDLPRRIGWLHRNIKSEGPRITALQQGLEGFVRADPLLHRTFGALVGAEGGERRSDRVLVSPAGTRHRFELAVLTRHPATVEQWLAEAQAVLDLARTVPIETRRAEHRQWWHDFSQRSWIEITRNGREAPRSQAFIPATTLPVVLGRDQRGGTALDAPLGRVSLAASALPPERIQALARLGPRVPVETKTDFLFSEIAPQLGARREAAGQAFSQGLTFEAWVQLDPKQARKSMRLIDQCTPGQADGWLIDFHPGSTVRVIVGHRHWLGPMTFEPGRWTHLAVVLDPRGNVTLFRDGAPVEIQSPSGHAGARAEDDDAFVVSQAYALQRYINACAGRGPFPIKFNGSLFTVPARGMPGHADYRRWGPGYWWQNTRLPYLSMCASGDIDLMQPLFQMYARDLLPLCEYRTRLYLGHPGAFYPETIYFWGDVLVETYGSTPFAERVDKLQEGGWHKREWVSGLELAGLLMDAYEHAGDRGFYRGTTQPLLKAVLTFFDRHYGTDAGGRLRLHPAQALETWWDCVNPMPELAGLHAITARALALPEDLTTAEDRAFWKQLQAKLPDLPLTLSPAGRPMLAPAEVFKNKRNIENPELYAVFPFRLIALGRPHLEWGREALRHRKDRGDTGWRQDDLFMAWLGETELARDTLVRRARAKHAGSRFPAFWGPNYDWIPDQDHGGVLLRVVQSLLMQTEGRKIYLLPAWPADWDADFKLHAPFQTTVIGRVEQGRLTRLEVTPPERRADVILPADR